MTLHTQPIEDWTYYTLGIVLIMVQLASLSINGTIVYLYFKIKELQNSYNTLVISLCGSFLGITIIGMPMIVTSCFARNWVFGNTGCSIFGFTMMFFGLLCIFILTLIAVDRYCSILKEKMGKRTIIISLFFCLMYSLIWSLCPVWGWSSYSLEMLNISCFVKWQGKDTGNISYISTIFLMGWIIPLTVICFSYLKILFTIRKVLTLTAHRMNIWQTEKILTVTILQMIGTFVLSWSPYAVQALLSIFGDPDNIHVILPVFSELSMKMSMLWVPIIYIRRSKCFQKAFRETFPKLYNGGRITPSPVQNHCSCSETTINDGRRQTHIPRAPTSGNEAFSLSTVYEEVKEFLGESETDRIQMKTEHFM